METHARYIAVGIFAIAVVASAFMFVFWLRGASGLEEVVYRIRFSGPVTGIVRGSPVLFNGVRVGEVTGVALDATDPTRTTVYASAIRGAPVRSDTKVEIETQGLLGAPALSLSGGSGPPLQASSGQPTLEAAGMTQDLSSVARGALQRFDSLIADNAANLRETIDNLKTFTGALARNSDKIDSILASLERLGGGGSAKDAVHVYELAAPKPPAFDKAPPGQLAVAEPSAVVAFDTQKILYRSSAGETLPAADGQWVESVPKLVQTKIIQTFENAGYMRVVRGADALSSDYQLLLDIRGFHVLKAPERAAVVELTAKIAEGGKVMDGRMFRATAPVRDDGVVAASAGLSEAFGQAATDLATWAAARLAELPPPVAPPADAGAGGAPPAPGDAVPAPADAASAPAPMPEPQSSSKAAAPR
jgi:phospholipid/cholesterol/gamma-HCH transport system substrate-binding protein